MRPAFAEARIMLVARSVRPRDALLVSEWADAHRRLSGKASSEQGQWKTSRTPFLREPMDALSRSSPVREVCLVFATQSGKTEVELNWVGYVMDHAPAPMLAVFPTVDPFRKRWVKQRLNPMLEDTPRLAAVFDSRKKRDGGNSEDLKDFPGGLLILGGSNSPSSLSSMPVQYVLIDELDRCTREVGSEGDLLGLVRERQKTFPRRKLCMVSTPTTEEESQIWPEWERSDQRHYHLPCPHCGHMQHLRWARIVAHPGGSVTYQCESCDEHIHEHTKVDLLARGQWRPLRAGASIRGYHLNGLYAPLGLGYTWAEAWAMWGAAQQDTRKLKRFINTFLAEIWRETAKEVDPENLLARCEDYADLPLRPLAATAGVDVQKDRLEATIVWWETEDEWWFADHVILPGDTEQDDVWADLDDLFGDHSIDAAAIDAGYRPDRVKTFCADRDFCFPTKGMEGSARPLIEDRRTRAARLRRRRRGGMPVEPIGVEAGKSLIYSNIENATPTRRRMHWPISPAFDREYFDQLTAEKMVTERNAGKVKTYWRKIRERNEALDCAVLALAALRLGVDLDEQRKKRAAKTERAATVKPFTPRVIDAETW